MKIINTIRIGKDTISEIKELECVKKVDVLVDGTITVYLDQEFTNGKQTANSGEYLCQFANKKWQRFGSEALNRTFKNPGKEAGRKWSE